MFGLPLTAGTIEKAITSLDGVVDDIGSDRGVDLPEAEAHLGHVIAAAELDNGRDHFVGCLIYGIRVTKKRNGRGEMTMMKGEFSREDSQDVEEPP